MTSPTEQVQALLQQIEAVLSKASPRLPWVVSGDLLEQRQVLERARSQLLLLQQQLSQGALSAPRLTGGGTPQADSAQQVLQAVLQEVEYLRINLIQPLRLEVEDLQRQRQRLIVDMEQRRGLGGETAQMQAVLDGFIQKLQDTMTAQLQQAIAQWPAAAPPPGQLEETNPPPTALTPGRSPAALPDLADQRLVQFDAAIRQIFDSLSLDLQTYQESMSQGLNRMHSMGHQGEMLFSTLVNHLAEQLGREASAYLGAGNPASPPVETVPTTVEPDEIRADAPADVRADRAADQPSWAENVPSSPRDMDWDNDPELDPEFLDVTAPIAAAELPDLERPEDAPNLPEFDLEIDPELTLDPADLEGMAMVELDPPLPTDLTDLTEEPADLGLDLPDLEIISELDPAIDPPTVETALFAPDATFDPEPPEATPEPAAPDIYQDLGAFYESLLGAELPPAPIAITVLPAIADLELESPAALSSADAPAATDITPDIAIDVVGVPAKSTDEDFGIFSDFGSLSDDFIDSTDTIDAADTVEIPAVEIPTEATETSADIDLSAVNLTDLDPIDLEPADIDATEPATSDDLTADIDPIAVAIDQALEAAAQSMFDYGHQALWIEPAPAGDRPLSPPPVTPDLEPAPLETASPADPVPAETPLDPSLEADWLADASEDLLVTDPAVGLAPEVDLPIDETTLQQLLAEDLSGLEKNLPALIDPPPPAIASPDPAIEPAATERQESDTPTLDDLAAALGASPSPPDPTPEPEPEPPTLPIADQFLSDLLDHADDRYDVPATAADDNLTLDGFAEDLEDRTDPPAPLDPTPEAISAPAPPAVNWMDEGLFDLGTPSTAPPADRPDLNEEPIAAATVAPLTPGDRPTPPLEIDFTARQQTWYLGLDVGASGLSAVVLNQTLQTQHPIFWTGLEAIAPRCYRLPATVSWQDPALAGDALSSARSLRLPWEPSHPSPADIPAIGLHRLKPVFRYGIPFAAGEPPTHEPLVQWSQSQAVPLHCFARGLEQLLATLKRINPTEEAENFGCQAVDLSPHVFYTALQSLAGVVVSYPANCPDTYVFNLREAILGAQLIADPAKIFFMEESIAATLSALPNPAAGQTIRIAAGGQPADARLQAGSTFVLGAGASTTELGVIELPEEVSGLQFEDFTLRSVPYAGDALDQDIVCQLLYPLGWQALMDDEPRSLPSSPPSPEPTWDWQLTYGGQPRTAWRELGLQAGNLPQPGEPDAPRREELRQQLQSTLLGQSLLEAAQHLKKQLPTQAEFVVALGDRTWSIPRKAFETQVLLPYIQLLNRHVNTLLSKTGLATQAVRQIICTGGSGSFAVMGRWLQQKFPQATIVKDTYASDQPSACSRVAYGLVNLPNYPHVLHLARQQYSDFFLLLELLRDFPPQPLPINRLMQRLERRGINTQVCYLHIMALLEGHLPPGLLPTRSGASPLRVTEASQAQLEELTVYPLFHKQEGQIYAPNPAQRDRLEAYLKQLFAHKHQTLEEPFLVPMELGV